MDAISAQLILKDYGVNSLVIKTNPSMVSNKLHLVSPGNYTVIQDGSINKTVLRLNLTLNNEMNCKLFNSCKKTKYATLVPSMQNAIGFTTFQVIFIL